MMAFRREGISGIDPDILRPKSRVTFAVAPSSIGIGLLLPPTARRKCECIKSAKVRPRRVSSFLVKRLAGQTKSPSFRTARNMRVVLGADRLSDKAAPVFNVRKIIKADYNT